MTNSKLSYIPIIGLEVHVELKTKSKMFCGCDANHFQVPPNTHTCPVCLGLPGALPVPNKKACEWCIMIGLALGCEINKFTYFERKNYFYPDLPKGYQITQYEKPFCYHGRLSIPLSSRDNRSTIGILKTIRVNRVHMEEDTGKLKHQKIDGKEWTLIDFNRSGVPLVEIVSEPDIKSSEEAIVYLKKLQQVIRYLGVSDCDMEKGSMRLEPTVNLKIIKHGRTYYTPLTELKNINSFRFVKKAIDYETKRHLNRFSKQKVTKDNFPKETRGYNEDKGITYAQREKEEAHDYRYFPEPDIPPIVLSKTMIWAIKKQVPELPDAKAERFQKQYGLSGSQTAILLSGAKKAEFFEKCIKVCQKPSPKLYQDIAKYLINRKPNIKKVTPITIIRTIKQSKKGLIENEIELTHLVNKIIKKHPGQVQDYQAGKSELINYFLGQLMAATKGKADPQISKKILKIQLAKGKKKN